MDTPQLLLINQKIEFRFLDTQWDRTSSRQQYQKSSHCRSQKSSCRRNSRRQTNPHCSRMHQSCRRSANHGHYILILQNDFLMLILNCHNHLILYKIIHYHLYIHLLYQLYLMLQIHFFLMLYNLLHLLLLVFQMHNMVHQYL